MRTVIVVALLLLQGPGRSPIANGVITGEIRSTDGTPASGLRVSAVSVTDATVANGSVMMASLAETDSSGRFRLEDLPAGRYYIMAGPTGVASYFPGVRTELEAQTITLTAGGFLSGVNFSLARPAAVGVKGRVTGVPAGIPAGMVRVNLLPQSGGTVLDAPVQSDGTFSVGKVPPGRYAARLAPPAVATPIVQFQADEQDVNVELSMGSMLIGRVVMDDGGKLPVQMTQNAAGQAQPAALALLGIQTASLTTAIQLLSLQGQLGTPVAGANSDPMSLIQIQGRRTAGAAIAAGFGGGGRGAAQQQFAQPVRADGYFIAPAAAGEYQIAATQLPYGYYVKAVRMDPTTSQLQVVMTTTPPPSETAGVKVSGRITGAIPAGPNWVRMQTLGTANSMGIVEQRVGEAPIRDDGTFEVLHVPPGTSTLMISSSTTGVTVQMRLDIADRDMSIDVVVAASGPASGRPATGAAPLPLLRRRLQSSSHKGDTMRSMNAKRVMAFALCAVGFVIGAVAPFHAQDGPATASPILRGSALAVDAAGNVFVLDGVRVRKAAIDGTIKTIAGNGVQGHKGDGGPATESGFEYPTDIALDANGNLFIADNLGHRIRKITSAGVITTVAGTGEPGFAGDGGPAVNARLQSPRRVAVDSTGSLYIADSGNLRVRKVNASGAISTIAGTGKAGFGGDGGPASAAQIDLVSGVAVDGTGNVYIADSGNARIRKVTARGVISTIAGTGKAGFSGDSGPATAAAIDPFNLTVDTAGNVFIVEINRIRKIGTDGIIRTVAGDGTSGASGDGGPAVSAQLRGPSAVAVDTRNNLYIADALNGRIRKVASNGVISLVAGAAIPAAPPLPATTAAVGSFRGLAGAQQLQVGNVPVLPSAIPAQRGLPTPPQPVASSGRPALLQTRLEQLSPSAKDCGHTPTDLAATVVSCVETAVRGKAAFIASFTQQGIDSQVILGLAALASGATVQVLFDSDPSGGSNVGARVSTRECANPQLNASGSTVRLTCG